LSRKDDFKKCAITATVAVNEGAEAYLALRAHPGPEGWRAVTTRIVGRGGKVRIGNGGLDFQNDERDSLLERDSLRPFGISFVLDDRGIARVTVGGQSSSISNGDNKGLEEGGAAGVFVKSGKVLIESLNIR
jgi:hypothetical protein